MRRVRTNFLRSALGALLLVVLAAAGAHAAERSTRPDDAQTCGIVAAAGPQQPQATRAEVLRSRGVPCATARRVVQQCIAGELGRGWAATSPEAAILLVKGRTRVAFHTFAGRVPTCVTSAQRRVEGVEASELNLQKVLTAGVFGPYEEPNSYPDKLPPPFRIVYEWDSPVTTNSASIPAGSVSTVDLGAYVRNSDGTARSVWFEWGQTRDLGSNTEKQAPPTRPDDQPVRMETRLSHLRAGTRYWWRAAANFDTPSGVETRYGVMGTFVTNPYPKIADPSRPCQSQPSQLASLFELTESLAIACATRTYSNSACFPACANFYNGKLTCDRAFPRNLNAGRWSFNIPEIGIPVSVDDLVSYWRSNDSNRFLTVPGKNKNSGGGDVGPVPGWHEWDVAQWAYPFTSTSTNVEFWIHCTEKWGGVIDGSALAAGDGKDRPSLTAPGTPQQLVATAAADGGVDVRWQPPAAASPTGVAGYYVTVTGWRRDEARVFAPNNITPVVTTTTTGRISPGQLALLRRTMPAGYDLYVAVGAISREGSVSTPATLPWPK